MVASLTLRALFDSTDPLAFRVRYAAFRASKPTSETWRVYSALEQATLRTAAQNGVNLTTLLGGRVRRPTTAQVIGLRDPGPTDARAIALDVPAGATVDPGWIGRLRQRLPHAHLQVRFADPASSTEAAGLAEALARAGADLLVDLVPADAAHHLRVPVPLGTTQLPPEPREASPLLLRGGLQAIYLDPDRVGGVPGVLALAAVARVLRVDVGLLWSAPEARACAESLTACLPGAGLPFAPAIMTT